MIDRLPQPPLLWIILGWIVAVLLILAFNFAAHVNDPDDDGIELP